MSKPKLWAVSIRDTWRNELVPNPEARERLVEFPQVLQALPPAVRAYTWTVHLWDWEGWQDALDRAGLRSCANDREQLDGVTLNTEQVLALYAPELFVCTVDAEFQGVPTDETQAELMMRWIDCTDCLVVTKNEGHVQALKQHFKHVRDEDAEEWRF